MEICWGEKVKRWSLVRLKEEKEEDRRLPPETAAMPKADGLRSLTPISSAVADKPLIECHVKHSSWMGKRDFVVFVVGRHRVDSGIYGMGGTGGSGTYGIYGIYLWNFRRSLPTDYGSTSKIRERPKVAVEHE